MFYYKNNMKKKIRFSANVLIAILVFIGWMLTLIKPDPILAITGFENLKFFTVLSNLFEGLVSILWFITFTATKGKTVHWLEVLKYIAAVSVFVTFTVVLVFLVPLYGILGMYKNANLFFHLIVPIAAFLEAVILSESDFTWIENLLVMIPPVAYGVGYLVNILVNGVGLGSSTNDFYMFLHWGYPVGILIFACIAGISFVLGLAIRLLRTNIAEGFKWERKKKKAPIEENEAEKDA